MFTSMLDPIHKKNQKLKQINYDPKQLILKTIDFKKINTILTAPEPNANSVGFTLDHILPHILHEKEIEELIFQIFASLENKAQISVESPYPKSTSLFLIKLKDAIGRLTIEKQEIIIQRLVEDLSIKCKKSYLDETIIYAPSILIGLEPIISKFPKLMTTTLKYLHKILRNPSFHECWSAIAMILAAFADKNILDEKQNVQTFQFLFDHYELKPNASSKMSVVDSEDEMDFDQDQLINSAKRATARLGSKIIAVAPDQGRALILTICRDFYESQPAYVCNLLEDLTLTIESLPGMSLTVVTCLIDNLSRFICQDFIFLETVESISQLFPVLNHMEITPDIKKKFLNLFFDLLYFHTEDKDLFLALLKKLTPIINQSSDKGQCYVDLLLENFDKISNRFHISALFKNLSGVVEAQKDRGRSVIQFLIKKMQTPSITSQEFYEYAKALGQLEVLLPIYKIDLLNILEKIGVLYKDQPELLLNIFYVLSSIINLCSGSKNDVMMILKSMKEAYSHNSEIQLKILHIHHRLKILDVKDKEKITELARKHLSWTFFRKSDDCELFTNIGTILSSAQLKEIMINLPLKLREDAPSEDVDCLIKIFRDRWNVTAFDLPKQLTWLNDICECIDTFSKDKKPFLHNELVKMLIEMFSYYACKELLSQYLPHQPIQTIILHY